MSNNNKFSLPIQGMHCRSCELLLEATLGEVKNVKKTEVDYKKGVADIYYTSNKPNTDELEKAIYEAGYKVGEPEEAAFFSTNKNDYKDLGIAVAVLAGIYFIMQGLGYTGFNVSAPSNPSGLGVVLMVGLVAGVSTCMALVGGLILGLSSKYAEQHPEATAKQKFKPHLFFILGRVLGYAMLGGILGVVGSAIQISGAMTGFLTIAVGLVMLLVGLQLIDIFPKISNFKFTLPKSVSKLVGLNKKQKEYSHKNSMIMGALTFFLPCGFTQAMQLYAVSTGDFFQGAMIMGAFALGTAPGLLSLGGLTAVVKGKSARRFFKFAGVIVILLALFNLNNGFTLAGFDLSSSTNQATSGPAVIDPNVSLENGVQVVHMIEADGGYSPKQFTIKKDVPVRWVIDGQAPYSCASTILLPKLNIRKNLVAGENTINFTPTEVGKLSFSCSMGMYTGAFNVVDGTNTGTVQPTSAVDANSQVPTSQPVASGSCGSSGGGCGCGGGGAKPTNINSVPVTAVATQDPATQEAIQVIKTTYTAAKYLDPSIINVKAGTKVRLEIDVRDNGVGCGNAIRIPGLYDNAQPLQAGSTITMEFTPTTPGSYQITCGMGMIRFGSITVQ